MLEARILTNLASVDYHLENYFQAGRTIEQARRIAARWPIRPRSIA